MRTFPQFVLTLAAAALFTAQLPAQNGNSAQPQTSAAPAQMGLESAELLRRLDADRNGFISRREWEDFFTALDQDKDGRLAPEEIEANFNKPDAEEGMGPDYGRLAAFERLDVNRNNAIDVSEWPGRRDNFDVIDANRDQMLSQEEFLSRNARYWNQKFENLDFNGDNVITRSEWLDSKASFDWLDSDNNGVIERREFYRR